MTKKIILDCDPGHDDAVAIMLAAASSEIEILGITCVGGNVGLNNTTNNNIKPIDNLILCLNAQGFHWPSAIEYNNAMPIDEIKINNKIKGQ